MSKKLISVLDGINIVLIKSPLPPASNIILGKKNNIRFNAKIRIVQYNWIQIYKDYMDYVYTLNSYIYHLYHNSISPTSYLVISTNLSCALSNICLSKNSYVCSRFFRAMMVWIVYCPHHLFVTDLLILPYLIVHYISRIIPHIPSHWE